MPNRPPTRCRFTGCYELVYNRYCKTHSSIIDKQRREKELWRNYTGDWKIIRIRVLHAEPYCRICQELATEVDHIIPLKNGGTHHISNLQPLCKSCHSKKTYNENLNKKNK